MWLQNISRDHLLVPETDATVVRYMAHQPADSHEQPGVCSGPGRCPPTFLKPIDVLLGHGDYDATSRHEQIPQEITSR